MLQPSDASQAPTGVQTTHRVLARPAEDLGELDDESVDLVVTSPPYPMIEMWDGSFAGQDPAIAASLAEGRGTEAFDRMHAVLARVWEECFRVLKPGCLACINVGDATRSIAGRFRLYSNHSRIITDCEAIGFETLPLVLWRKQTNAPNKFMGSGMLPGGAYVTLEHEYILVLRKGGKREFGPDERARRRESAFFWEERNRWFSDVWEFKGVRQIINSAADSGSEPPGHAGDARAGGQAHEREPQARQRTGAFPFELAYRLINMYSMRHDTVLDPFLGTGTTTVAAIAAARSSVGAEIDPDVAAIVADTVADAAGRLNVRVWERVTDHLEFVRRYEADHGKPPGHLNRSFGFPVMTGQEEDLILSSVESVEREDDTKVRAAHRDLDAGNLERGAPAPPELAGFGRPF
ncbi:MAG: site-specific DNA-methyltransferase [Spirochaetes bacterium]|jgi:DNA modification methylase|nr:site-specific DNA-methyltransferase [Spirochaetota bacterium]